MATEQDVHALLEAIKGRGFVYYEEISRLFPDPCTGGPELDRVLSQFESAAIQIVPDPEHTAVGEDLSEAATFSEDINDPLHVYLGEVAKVPPLTSKRVKELAERISVNRVDADQAKKQLVEAHLSLVVHIARRYRRSGMDRLDLIQHGNEGLVVAADTFKYGRGYSFSTYASFLVHRAVNAWLRTEKR